MMRSRRPRAGWRAVGAVIIALGPLATPALAQSSPGPGAAGQQPAERMMSDADLLASLQQRGFEQIGELRRDGDTATTTAVWLGEPVRVRITADTGQLLEPAEMTAGQARELLRQQGYGDIRDLRRANDLYVARAMHEGRRVGVSVSAMTGVVFQDLPPSQPVGPPVPDLATPR